MDKNQTNTALAVAPQQTTALDFFGTISGFESGQRIAKLFAASSLVPDTFKGDVGGCLIALEMAQRMKANVLQVMQSLYIVHGKPTLSSAFLIASFNQTGKFSPIRYEFDGTGDEYGCRAVTTDRSTGEVITSTKVTIGMAKAEGWYDKKGSKWRSMPDLMLRYRAATFLIRTTAPEIALGFHTTDEMRDVYDVTERVQVISSAPTTLDEVAMQTIVPTESEKEQTAEEVAEAQAELFPDPEN